MVSASSLGSKPVDSLSHDISGVYAPKVDKLGSVAKLSPS